MTIKILVVEDELILRQTLAYNLQKQGYEVLQAEDGYMAVELARQERPAAVILDVMLPGLDGFEVCRVLRREMNAAILMLTARDDEVDKVVGLEVGADDYMTKPFSLRELLARVKALLRRERLIREELAAQDAQSASPLVFDDLTLDESRHELRKNGEVVALKPKEYDLLLFMARQRGLTLSRELILERVWGWDFDGGSRTVDVHIRWLREKIESDPSAPVRLVTVRGAGYRFEG
ncbi:MAG: response regulator transcription factor [Caldilineales bacterium]